VNRDDEALLADLGLTAEQVAALDALNYEGTASRVLAHALFGVVAADIEKNGGDDQHVPAALLACLRLCAARLLRVS
jgi:hypothetical protein